LVPGSIDIVAVLGFLGIHAALAMAVARSRRDLEAFLGVHPSMQDAQCLTEFKRIARWNMRMAACFLALAFVSIAFAIHLAHEFGPAGVALVLAVNVPGYYMAQRMKAIELRARSLDCNDAALRDEYGRIATSWVKKLWPDF